MEELIFWGIVALRLGVPLAIPRFPIPAMAAALVIDAADQTIFAAFDVEPDNYQGYDKALDVYYLAIAYVATIRNWTDGGHFRVGQFLWYWRLVGVVSFELSGVRALLVVFPNTFEYFFDAYEGVRLKWDPRRLSLRHVIGLAAFIWIVIKIPQELWIHVFQLDFTDVMGDHPWLWAVLAAVVAGAAALLYANRARYPRADWPLNVDVDAHGTTALAAPAELRAGRWAVLDHPFAEKVVLLTLITVIFSQVLPGVDATGLQVALAVAALVAADAAAGTWLVRHGVTWRTTAAELVIMMAVNTGIAVGATALLRRGEGTVDLTNLLFFVGLLTLIVTLYDRYRTLRVAAASRPAPA